MKGKELLLTRESIANEGIEIKVSQSDVIDALVEEQISVITSQVEAVQLSAKAILDSVKAELQASIDVAVGVAPISKHLSIVDTDYTRTYSGKRKEVELLTISDGETRAGTTLYRRRGKCDLLVQGDVRLVIKYEGTLDGISVVGKHETTFTHKSSKKLIKAIEEHNQRVEALAEILPEKGINEREIAKKIKNQFTKEILKTSSPEFKQKMLDGFGITL